MTPDPAAVRAFLAPEHVARAAELSALAAERLAPRPHAAGDDAARREARALVKVLADAGFYASIAARDLRGSCLAREALAAVSPLADAVWALQALGTTPLLAAAAAAPGGPAARWAEAALAGDAIAAFAMTEPDAGSDVAALRTAARPVRGGWSLRGTKTFISNAGIADFYVTFASTTPGRGAKGISCFLVPADAPGFRFVKAQVLSEPHPLGEIAFEDCEIGADHLLGAENEGLKLGLGTLDGLRATVAAAACGMAARALDEAVAHARARVQFGVPLAEHQIVREKLARMAIELTAARLLTYRAAWEKDGGAERVSLESSMAKAYATEAAQRIVDDAVQILGGRGVLCDHPVDRLYRAVRALRIYEGTTEIHHLVVAGRILAAHGAAGA